MDGTQHDLFAQSAGLPEGTIVDDDGLCITLVKGSEFAAFCRGRRVLAWNYKPKGYEVEWKPGPELTRLLSPADTGVRQRHRGK